MHNVDNLRKPNRFFSKKGLILIIFCLLWWMVCSSIIASPRIPRPEFETEYAIPNPTTPEPRNQVFAYIDIAALILALSISSYLVLKRRSRTGVFWFMILSLLYFGFYRRGCICSIGTIQNIAMSIFNPNYSVSIFVIAYFILPLVFTLFFGRTYCASVCPLGAIQDLVAIRPVKVPAWIAKPLSILPYIYLGLSVLTSATSSGFLICRYDPFVGFFRLSAEAGMFIFGAIVLLIGVFVARPYCRFLCPYGVLLNWMSRFSKWHMTITPDECVDCNLCEESCPFGVLNKPTEGKINEKIQVSRRRLTIIILLVPVLIFIGGSLGSSLNVVISYTDSKASIIEQIMREESGLTETTTVDSQYFRETGTPIEELQEEVESLKDKLYFGGWFFGGFVGLAFGLMLIGLAVKRKREIYEPDRAECFSCARCIPFCPREHERKKIRKAGLH